MTNIQHRMSGYNNYLNEKREKQRSKHLPFGTFKYFDNIILEAAKTRKFLRGGTLRENQIAIFDRVMKEHYGE